jgi:dimethylaniline monooxygenase (N-oxide forming)
MCHVQVLRYIEEYAAHFDLKKNIQFQTTVTEIVPHKGGGYDVSTQKAGGSKPQWRHFTTVIVANGHHWDPLFPELPGKFAGKVLHAHQYRNHSILDGKRVVVLGMGNSGACLMRTPLLFTAIRRHPL